MKPVIELRCGRCGWSEVCRPASVVDWLRKAGKARYGRGIDEEFHLELLRGASAELRCPACGERGLRVGLIDDDQDWPEARACVVCRRPIPPERLDALPEAEMCADCQSRNESGAGPVEIDYCPKCGAPMRVQLSRAAGLSRYVQVCTNSPPCRR